MYPVTNNGFLCNENILENLLHFEIEMYSSCPCYSTDTQNELELIKKMAKESGAFDAVICNHWAKGGAGAAELAGAVERASQAQSNFKFLYDLNVSFI